MQTKTFPLTVGNRTPGVRVAIITIGYLITLAGVLSIFSIPISISLAMVMVGFAGTGLAARGVYAVPPVTWRVGLVWMAGSIVILGVLWLIGEDRVRHWVPHPAGYGVAWFICLCAFRHFRQIMHSEPAPTTP